MATLNAAADKTAMKSSILIVDDHPVVRWGIGQMVNLEPDLTVCCEAGDEKEALEAQRQCRHDLVIVDISLEGTSGLAVIKSLLAANDRLPILVMSMHDESIYAERALRAGARGYVMKQEAPANVLKAIRQVLGGGIFVSEKMSAKLLKQTFDASSRAGGPPIETLSDTELEVLRLIGRGLSTREVAELMNRSIKTVETHRGNIRSKLGLKSGLDLVHFAARWLYRRD